MASHLLFKSPDGAVVKVKLGFSWQAFFVGSFRAVLRRTWLIVSALAIGYFTIAWMGRSFADSSRNVALLVLLLGAYVGYMAFCGLYGNRWLIASLLRRGYRQVAEEPQARSPGRSAAGTETARSSAGRS